MVEKETDFKPGIDYLNRLRSGDFEFRLRNEATDWIWKACVHHHFGPLCIYLSINYFDRFLTTSELPKDKDWAIQLLAVSCLSLAAKMEETYVPQSLDLQVEDPKFVFEAKTIKIMELLIKDHHLSETDIYRSSQLILNTTKGVVTAFY
ncbi:unnamed protein product [Arabis nemorensis]|uniref:Cyclin-like domain-containing protein n=1 Tax=Arabis nemorensis TaxID=586526 RepID=A0A565C891_9BRAS|nr:unnamed protein product [Arabis nemorensis]